MGKVFTITEGLENMGALKSGGQGSVYKARRTGEIISAVKMLPTPVFSESGADKSYADFINEVQKLLRVNEQPTPHVVRILNHGITESGAFPFIEMEFIDGPDLEELLQPPYDPVFPIKEAIKVAEHLASALAHCHRVDVKHGDIKSNNVKFNQLTGNYMLLDFGLALLSSEVRRTSLRRAGSVEFMAPEQSDGQLLFQSDVYGFGVILFELLAGIVPFPVSDNTDTDRNRVMLAQRETAPPDLMALRKGNMPLGWSDERIAQEMAVPAWLIDVVYQCLEKAPARRFDNGMELYEVICANLAPATTKSLQTGKLHQVQQENRRLQKENRTLQEVVKQHTGAFVDFKAQPSLGKANRYQQVQRGLHSSKKWFFTALALTLLLLALFYFYQGSHTLALNRPQPVQPKDVIGQYKVAAPRAYFFSRAHPDSKKRAYLIPSNDVISAINEANGFVYTEFTSAENKAVKGWLSKNDLVALNSLVNDKGKLANVRIADADVATQLQEARQLMANGQEKRALYIYNYLAGRNVPEAMYQYGNLALQNRNTEISCKRGYELVYQASKLNFTPAKSTIGFLFAFGNNSSVLQSGGYNRCKFNANSTRGAQLLLEATLEGDTAAKKWLLLLNQQLPRP